MTEPADSPDPPGRWGAFSYPRYRRYWVAMVARVFGLQFRYIGLFWFVQSSEGLDLPYRWLGIVGLAASLPTIALTVPAGVVADRYEHRSIMVISQSLTALLTFTLAIGIVLESIDVWMLMAWAIVVGSLAALATPAQQAILPRLIDMRAMPSAVALTSSVWNTMRIVGPGAAGLLIAALGIGQAFFVAAAGSALSTVLIATLRLEPLERDRGQEQGGMLVGIRYIAGNRLFLAIIGLSFFTSIFGMSYQTLLPIFAEEILDSGARGFGFMHTAAGCGGLLGTLAIIKIGARRQAGAIMLASAGLFGIFIALFAGSRILELSLVLLFCAGFASSLYLNLGMTLLQMFVPDELRGRVMGVWSMTWFLSAVGALPASAVAEWIGAPLTVALGALAVTAFALALVAVATDLRHLPELERRSPERATAAGGR